MKSGFDVKLKEYDSWSFNILLNRKFGVMITFPPINVNYCEVYIFYDHQFVTNENLGYIPAKRFKTEKHLIRELQKLTENEGLDLYFKNK